MPSKHSAFGRGARPLKCRQCGAKRTDTCRISARGLCTDCALANQEKAARQISAEAGPYYDRWVESMVETGERLAARSG